MLKNINNLERYKEHLWVSLIVLLAYVVYQQIIVFDPINYDDYNYFSYIQSLASIKKASVFNSVFTDVVNGNWAPVTILSFYIDYLIHGDVYGKYHMTSLLIHLANIPVAYLTVKALTKNQFVALVSVTFFAIHPINIESISWISERKGLLAAFFVLCSFYCYLRYDDIKNKYFWYSSVILFCLGMMSKASIVSYPILLIAYHYFCKQDDLKSLITNYLYRFIPYFVISLLIGGVTTYVHYSAGALKAIELLDFSIRANNFALALLAYAIQLVYPLTFSPFYGYVYQFNYLEVLGGYGLIAILVFYMFKQRIKYPLVAFSLAWFFILLLPTSPLFQTGGHQHADRYLYIPAIGIFIICAMIFSYFRVKSKKTIYAFFITITLLLSLNSYFNAKNWKNSATIYHLSLVNVGGTFKVHANLSLYYLDMGNIRAGMYHYTKAIEKNAKVRFYDKVYKLLYSHGYYSEAKQVVLDEIKIFPDDFSAYIFLAQLLVKQGEIKEAEETLLSAKNKNATFMSAPDFNYALGAVYDVLGQTDLAKDYYHRAISLEPNSHSASLSKNRLEKLNSKSPK